MAGRHYDHDNSQGRVRSLQIADQSCHSSMNHISVRAEVSSLLDMLWLHPQNANLIERRNDHSGLPTFSIQAAVLETHPMLTSLTLQPSQFLTLLPLSSFMYIDIYIFQIIILLSKILLNAKGFFRSSLRQGSGTTKTYTRILLSAQGFTRRFLVRGFYNRLSRGLIESQTPTFLG